MKLGGLAFLFSLSLAAPGCGSDHVPSPDAGPVTPGVTVSGQVVRAPGTPLPIENVTVSVIDPAPARPDYPPSARSNAQGAFVIHDVHPTAGGRIRLLIDGTTGGGGPYVVMHSEFAVDATAGADLGTIALVKMDPTGTVVITADNAMLSRGADGRTRAQLKVDIPLSGGYVPGGTSTELPRAAQLRLPAGIILTFPLAAPLLVNITGVELAAIPAPMPIGADGMPRFTSYFV